jgi:C-terminal processing protease CtpA/Prc
MDLVMRFREWAETGAIGLILDLRGAGGSDNDATKSIASLFCPGNTLLGSIRDRNDQDVRVYRSPESNPVTIPAILLVDADTHGMAEVLAATLRDASSSVLIMGQPTSGDMNLREVIELPGGDLLWIATRKLVTATGRIYDGREGLHPDLLVPKPASPELFFEPILEPGRREILDVEYVDAALRRRVRADPALRLAADLVIGLKALEMHPGAAAR